LELLKTAFSNFHEEVSVLGRRIAHIILEAQKGHVGGWMATHFTYCEGVCDSHSAAGKPDAFGG
jgi:hypothetical protein